MEQREPLELVYRPTAPQVARALIAAGAYRLSSNMADPRTWFTWKSEIRAPVYTDCRSISADPGATGIVVEALSSALLASFPHGDCVVGVAEGGIVWSSCTAYRSGLPHAFVRKQQKLHGLRGQMVEGSPRPNSKAVLVDDLMASGQSLDRAMTALAREYQIETIGVQTIVNWNFPEMRERFYGLEIPVRALVSYPELLAVAGEVGLLTAAAIRELKAFYNNPREHIWDYPALRHARANAADS